MWYSAYIDDVDGGNSDIGSGSRLGVGQNDRRP